MQRSAHDGGPTPAADDTTEVPPLADANVAFTLISVAIVVLLLQLMQSVVIPFVLGGLLFYALDPAVDRLQKMRLPRVLGAAAMLLIDVTGVRGAGLLATRPGADRYRSVARRRAQAGGTLRRTPGVDRRDRESGAGVLMSRERFLLGSADAHFRVDDNLPASLNRYDGPA